MANGVPGVTGLPVLKHVVSESRQEIAIVTTLLLRMMADLVLEIVKKHVHVH